MRSLIPTWKQPWTWHLPWWVKTYDEDLKIYANFAGFGPIQFYWWSS